MTTTTQAFASGTPVVSPSAKWTTPTNATGSSTSTAVATYTTAISAEVGTIQLAGYAMSTSTMGAINSVAVQVWSYVTATNRWTSASVQLLDSVGVAIGAAQTLTLSATTTNNQTLAFTGVTTAQIAAGIQVKLSATKSGTTSNAFNVNAVGVTVDYAGIVAIPTTQGFETDAGNFAPSVAGASVSRITQQARSGSSALRLIGSASQVSPQATGKFSGFTIGQQYAVTVGVLPYTTTSIVAPYADASLGVVGLSGVSLTLSSSWQQLSYVFTATATTHDIYIGSTGVGSNSSYSTVFDDFAIDVARVVPYSNAFETDNAGFVAAPLSQTTLQRLGQGRNGGIALCVGFINGISGTAQANATFYGFVPGKQYMVSVWVDNQINGPSQTVGLGITGLSSSTTTGTAAYQLVTYTFSATSSSHEVYFTTTSSSNNGTNFDDLSIVEVLRSPPYSANFDNDFGGFGNGTNSQAVRYVNGGRTGSAIHVLTASGSATASQLQTFAGLTVGYTYGVSIWVRSAGDFGPFTAASIGVTGLSSSSLTMSASYQQLVYTFTATSTSHEIYFSAQVDNQIGGLFDDFSIYVVGSGATASGDVKFMSGATFTVKLVKVVAGGSWTAKPVKLQKAGAYTVTPY